MTALMAVWRAGRAVTLRWYRSLRGVHPVRVLRWLRNGVLAAVAATALLYLLVATEAGHQIAAVRRTSLAISDIGMASVAANDAEIKLKKAFHKENVTLIGTGTAFTDDTAQVSTYVASASEDNAAGAEGRAQIQFVQGQLITCIQLAETAVGSFPSLGPAVDKSALDALNHGDEKDPMTHEDITGTGGLIASLSDLKGLQKTALNAQLGSRWLHPAYSWPLLLAPVIVMLLLAAATGYVLARHFRRFVSPLLVSALLITTAVSVAVAASVAVASLAVRNDPQSRANLWAGHPATIAVVLALLAAAAGLTYLAYRPRLAEYRFEPS